MAILVGLLLMFGFVLLVIAGVVATQQPEPALLWRRLLCFGLACWCLAEVLARAASLPVFQQLTR